MAAIGVESKTNVRVCEKVCSCEEAIEAEILSSGSSICLKCMQSSAYVPVFIPSNVRAFLTVEVHDLVFADRLLRNSVYIKFFFKVRDDTKSGFTSSYLQYSFMSKEKNVF